MKSLLPFGWARKRRCLSVLANRKTLLRSMPIRSVSCFSGTGAEDAATASRNSQDAVEALNCGGVVHSFSAHGADS